MKRIIIGLAILLTVSTVAAMAMGPIGFGIHATYANLNMPDPFKQVYGPGYGGGVHLDLNLPMIHLRLSGDYTTFGMDQSKFSQMVANLENTANTAFGQPLIAPSDLSVSGGRIGILAVSLNAQYAIGFPVVSPYVTAGVGTSTISVSDMSVSYQNVPIPGVTSVASQTKFSANAGVGVAFHLGIELFAEAKYTWIFTEGTASTYVPITVGVTF